MNSLCFRSIALALGVVFSFSSIAMSLLINDGRVSNFPHAKVQKHDVSYLTTGNLLAFEEKEDQRETVHQHAAFLFTYIAFDFKPNLYKADKNCNHYDSSRMFSHPELYLIIRSLLI